MSEALSFLPASQRWGELMHLPLRHNHEPATRFEDNPAEDAQATVKIHGTVKVYGAREHVPWTAEFPEEQLAYDGLVLLLPGWGGIKRSSRGERHANATTGYASVSYDPARISGNLVNNLFDSQQLHTSTAEAVLNAARDAVTSTRRKLPHAAEINVDKAILSDHSMGGFAATELALKHPGIVEAVIHKGAAGFSIPCIDIPAFISEMHGYVYESGQIERSARHLYRIMRYYMRSPSRTAGEALTCISGDLRERTTKLGELGVKRAYIGFENDSLLPPKDVQQNAAELFDIFTVMPGTGHLAPQVVPRATSETVLDVHRQLTAWA